MQYFSEIRCELGESPLWHPQRQCYYWVDITQKVIHCLSGDKIYNGSINLPDKVGCIVLASNGNLIAALSRSLVEVDLDSKETNLLYQADIDANEMFNDGKIDSKGRLWVATKDIDEANPIGALYCYDGKSLLKKEDNVIVGNGIDWNLTDNKMYFTDSPRQIIYQYDFDSSSGDLADRQVFATVDHGYPDGLTVDAKGQVWGAHWNGEQISCYNERGERLKTLAMPCQKPTSCCFGGKDYTELFITSASIGMSEPLKNNGHAFFCNLQTQGKPSNCFLIRRCY